MELIPQRGRAFYPYSFAGCVAAIVRISISLFNRQLPQTTTIIATICLLWDIAQVFWFLPISWISPLLNFLYYSIIGEAVYFPDENVISIPVEIVLILKLIGMIKRSFDLRQGDDNVIEWVADVAVAELTTAKSIENCTVLEWETGFSGEDEKLYLLGTAEEGSHQTLDTDGNPAITLQRTLVGGIRYQLAVGNHDPPSNYYICPILWRSKKITISGLSGAALVRRATTGKFHVVGFQSHELRMYGINLSWWKVAFPPPQRMQKDFIPIAPSTILMRHDENKGPGDSERLDEPTSDKKESDAE